MNKPSTILLIALSWLLMCRCAGSPENDGKGRDYPSKETFDAIDRCMGYMHSDPKRAHTMLDSLRSAKLMTEQRCEYYHAMVAFSGEDNLDGALAICDRLLDGGEYGDDRFLEEEICVLASDITTANKRNLATLRYAKRGIEICHGNELMRSDEATLMARVGAAEQELGRMEQARETYERASQLLNDNASFADLIARISLQKKQASLCQEQKEYDKAIAICHEIQNVVERFDQDPSFVEQRPETMQKSGDATHHFAGFYHSQMYGHIARLYRMKVEDGLSANAQADTDSVRTYMERWSATDGAQSPDNMANSIRELYFVGMMDQFAEAKGIVEQLYQGDSIVAEYADYLKLMAEDAASRLDLKASNEYLKRALAIGDSISQHETMRVLSEQMSINMVQEQKLAREDAEQQLARHKLIILLQWALLAIIIISGAVITYLVRKNKESRMIIETTQHDLNETKEEIIELEQQLEDTKAEKAATNMKALYERIGRVMSEQSLYLKPDLDIKMVAEAANSSRSVVSTCINSTTGKPFRQWLAEYRLSLFEQMLKANPDEPIDVLMMRCGYKDQSTFRRQFKATYGMTAGEYKKKLEEANLS